MTAELKDINNNATILFTDKDNGFTQTNEAILSQWIEKKETRVFAAVNDKVAYSTALGVEIFLWGNKLQEHHITLDLSKLPENIRDMAELALKNRNTPPTVQDNNKPFLETVGQTGYSVYTKVKSVFGFIHQTNLSLLRFMSGNGIWRKKDFWFIFSDCSYKAVGIVSLVSFLVGLILAFVGALQLEAFGAGIYVASMVAMGMTRIMAAIMVGIIMAGRTGSSYAATIGTMQVNEEIDALKTLGVKITDYLVAPRLVALVLTIPFLTMLADVMGIFGGALVGISFLNISTSSYFDYTIKALTLTNILVGMLHSLIYGIIISLCGCYEGLNAGRDADSVGKATTGAVVTALVWMIVATGILTVILKELNI